MPRLFSGVLFIFLFLRINALCKKNMDLAPFGRKPRLTHMEITQKFKKINHNLVDN